MKAIRPLTLLLITASLIIIDVFMDVLTWTPANSIVIETNNMPAGEMILLKRTALNTTVKSNEP